MKNHPASAPSSRAVAFRLPIAAALITAVLAGACASAALERRFTELLHRYPATKEPLAIRPLLSPVAHHLPKQPADRDVIIMVHPAYSLFFRDSDRSRYSAVKYELLKFQLDSEARFIAEAAQAGKTMVLVLPGRYGQDSIAPGSYVRYLNTVAGAAPSVFFVLSETSNSGTLPADEMVTLYRFLQDRPGGKLLIGGGYIGRCQKEFYEQVANHLERGSVYLVPEISSISPDDISDSGAAHILDGIRRRDYGPVRKFIEKRNQGQVDILSIPPRREL